MSESQVAPEYYGAEIHEQTLSNGMRVLVAERHHDPVVSIMVWYGVGARHEPPELAGVSHFLEHMMFKGTTNHGKGSIDLATTTRGGTNNAFTTPDHTAYWFEFASDRWEGAVELEADRMRNLLLDPEEFDSEKQVVLEELSMGLDDPWRSLSQKVTEVLFGRHPYSRPVIGYRDTLDPMTPAMMRGHYDAFYRPENATLVIAGDVDRARAMGVAEANFGGIVGPGAPGAVSPPRPLPSLDSSVRVETTWDDQASRLIMAWPGAVFGSDEDFALDVAVTALSTGKLSRLYRRLVIEEGLATSVSASNDARAEAGGLWIYAEAMQGASTEALEAAILQEVQRLRDEEISADELVRAKKLLAASEAFGSQTVTEIAETLGEYATDLDWRRALGVEERRSAVTAASLKEVCGALLDPGVRVVGWSRPEAPAAAEVAQ